MVVIAPREESITGLVMTSTTQTIETTTLAPATTHDFATCPGCDHVMKINDLAAWLGESVHTLYKWSSWGYPEFPKRLKLRNGRVASTCRFVKEWIAQVAS